MIKTAIKQKMTRVRSKLRDIAKFLEESGFIDAANKVNCAMDAVDGSLEDNLNDSIISSVPDTQMNYLGSGEYMMTGEPAGGMQGAFSIPEAEKVAELANKLDKLGMYKEASELDEILEQLLDDDMPEIINDLEEKEDKKSPKKKKEKKDDQDKAGIETLVGANGHVGTGVTDNQNCGMFQGFSDAYFYTGYGNLEGPYK